MAPALFSMRVKAVFFTRMSLAFTEFVFILGDQRQDLTMGWVFVHPSGDLLPQGPGGHRQRGYRLARPVEHRGKRPYRKERASTTSRESSFTKPVYAGDEINIWVTLDKVMPKRNRARLATLVENQEGQTVLRGMAEIIPPLRNAA